jgi:molybdopterin synthase sulfur carrier subunit
MKVLLFGRLRDVAGWRETTLEPAPESLFALERLIAGRWPELAAAISAPGVQAAVDRSLVAGDVTLSEACEVAFLPPMSGG